MKTIRYTKMEKKAIVDILLAGGIVAFPTDTVFGLACMMDKKAMDKVYGAKGRSFDKPLPMMCNSLDMIKEVALVSEQAEKIIQTFTPGPLTLIFNKRENIDDYVTMGKKTIGIRVPDDDYILDLISLIGKPIMVTSANVSGAGSLLKWEDVASCMEGKIDAIVCEDARGVEASTIIDVSKDPLTLLRQVPITLQEIEEIIK